MRRLLCFILLAALFTVLAVIPAGYAKASSKAGTVGVLHINEIMSSNTYTVRDGDFLDEKDGLKGGSYSDWLEIYNLSGKAIDLTGYKLSDSAATWIFPKGIVPANGYLLIWASGKDKVTPDGQLHTNFKLDASGETITLANPDGSVCDSIKYISMSDDESYGAKTDGYSSYVTFSEATPGASNSEGILPVQPPVFSKEGGLYTEAFNLVLSTSDLMTHAKDAFSERESIYYTLDGSDPVPGALGTIKYIESIPVKSKIGEPNNISLISTGEDWKEPKGEVFKCWTIKAVTVSSDGEKSKIITNSYFVDTDIFKRYSLPIISIVTDKSNIFDSKKGLYTTKGVREPIHIEAYDKDGSLWFSQYAGAELFGHSTAKFPQKPLKIYASEDYDDKDTFKYNIFPGLKDSEGNKIKSFKRLLLRNSGNDWYKTMLRDGLMQNLVSHLNIGTQAYRPSVVFLNGEFWGIHDIRERYDKYYFASHFNLDKDKLAILSWGISENETIDILEGSTQDKDAYLNDIIAYLKANSIEEKSVYENIKAKMDVNNFIEYQLSQIYFANPDWPGNNVVAWKYKTVDGKYHPEAPAGQDGRWRWALKDTDLGFGFVSKVSHNTLVFATTQMPEDTWENGLKYGRNYSWAVFLLKTLLRNSEFRNEFINRFADNLNTSFDTVRVNQKIDEMKADIEKAMPEHIDRWQGITDWNSNVENLKAFANKRPDYMRKFILKKFTGNGVTGTSKVSLNTDSNRGYIKINSIDIKTSTPGVKNPGSWTGTYFKGVPVTLSAVPENGYKFSHWEGKGIPTADKTSDTIVFDPTGDTDIKAFFDLSLNDINGHWAESRIIDLMNNGIIKAFPDSTFKPEDNIDRASAATVITKIIGLQTVDYNKEFDDKIPDWAQDSIMALFKAGIINGYEDNTFRAKSPISRQELAVMIVKALGYMNPEAKTTSFKDNDKIGSWSAAYVAKAFELQLIEGYRDKSFRPGSMITKAEFAAIIFKVMDMKTKR